MSGVLTSFGHLWDRVLGHTVGIKIGNATPRAPIAPPPTTDEAAMQTQDLDRIRRRQGVLANIYGGSGSSTPTVGQKTLLGS